MNAYTLQITSTQWLIVDSSGHPVTSFSQTAEDYHRALATCERLNRECDLIEVSIAVADARLGA